MLSKKTLYTWHKRLGLTLGFILFVLALSGVFITYRDELLPLTYPDLIKVEPRPVRAPLVTQIEAVRAYLGNTDFTHYYTAEDDGSSSLVFFRPQGAILPHLVAIDPYTAEVRGQMPLIKNIYGVMLYIHANLLMGKVGGWIVGFMGLLLTAFFVSGLILFWPREGWLHKVSLLPKSGIRGLHRGMGLFLGLPLVFSALTGFILAFDLAQPWGRMFGDPAKPEEKVETIACDYQKQLEAILLLTPEQQANIVSIHFCSPKNGLMKFSYGHHERSGHDGYVRLVVDPRGPTVVQTFDTEKDPASWTANALVIYPMHTGAYFGGLGRILILLCGFALMGLYFTGLWPTLKKKLKR